MNGYREGQRWRESDVAPEDKKDVGGAGREEPPRPSRTVKATERLFQRNIRRRGLLVLLHQLDEDYNFTKDIITKLQSNKKPLSYSTNLTLLVGKFHIHDTRVSASFIFS